MISIGRLDKNSEGLLLLTNDGELARRLEHPSTGLARDYRVRVRGHPDPKALKALEEGVSVDGINYAPVQARIDRQQGQNCWLNVQLREGKNREIRRIFESMGYPVSRLIRTAYGPYHLGDMRRGAVIEADLKELDGGQ
mgnify:CR=1 FL=1